MLLSIITITFNNLIGLKRTVSSIDLRLDCELIIIDGYSNDQTQKYLNTLSNPKIICVSEIDDGIYDAMNKGLKIAQGEYVIFMNAGDSFYNTYKLPELFQFLKEKNPDILYGETMYVNSENQNLGLRSDLTTRKLPRQLSWSSMKYGMLVCHQSFIARRAIAPNYVNNNLSSDIDWIIKCLKKAKKINLFDGIIAKYQIGGISSQKHFQSLFDRFKVMAIHYGVLTSIIFHFYFVLRDISYRFVR